MSILIVRMMNLGWNLPLCHSFPLLEIGQSFRNISARHNFADRANLLKWESTSGSLSSHSTVSDQELLSLSFFLHYFFIDCFWFFFIQNRIYEIRVIHLERIIIWLLWAESIRLNVRLFWHLVVFVLIVRRISVIWYVLIIAWMVLLLLITFITGDAHLSILRTILLFFFESWISSFLKGF